MSRSRKHPCRAVPFHSAGREGAAREDHASGAQRSGLRIQQLQFALRAQRCDLRVILPDTELLGLRFHVHRQRKAVGYAGKPRIIFNFIRRRHLPAGGKLLEHQRGKARAAAVECRGQAGWAGADNDYIVNLIEFWFHCKPFLSAAPPASVLRKQAGSLLSQYSISFRI